MEIVYRDRYRSRFMKNKPTVIGTVAGMTGLIGMLPLLITLGIAQFVDLSALVLAIIHVALSALGAWVFTVWFSD